VRHSCCPRGNRLAGLIRCISEFSKTVVASSTPTPKPDPCRVNIDKTIVASMEASLKTRFNKQDMLVTTSCCAAFLLSSGQSVGGFNPLHKRVFSVDWSGGDYTNGTCAVVASSTPTPKPDPCRVNIDIDCHAVFPWTCLVCCGSNEIHIGGGTLNGEPG
jgi:hypothetical protein